MIGATFAGVALADVVPDVVVTDVRRSLLGERRDTYDSVPGMAGSWLFPDEPGDRKVTLAVTLLAGTGPARRASLRALAQWADSSQAERLVISDEPDRYWLAKVAVAPEPDELPAHATVEVEFRTGPYALALDASVETWTAEPGEPHAFTLPDEIGALPVVEVSAGAALSSLTLTVNGAALSYDQAIAGDGKITVSTLAYVVTTGADGDPDLIGAFDPATVSMSKVDGEFPVLVAGANTVTVDGACDVRVRWRRRYR